MLDNLDKIRSCACLALTFSFPEFWTWWLQPKIWRWWTAASECLSSKYAEILHICYNVCTWPSFHGRSLWACTYLSDVPIWVDWATFPTAKETCFQLEGFLRFLPTANVPWFLHCEKFSKSVSCQGRSGFDFTDGSHFATFCNHLPWALATSLAHCHVAGPEVPGKSGSKPMRQGHDDVDLSKQMKSNVQMNNISSISGSTH